MEDFEKLGSFYLGRTFDMAANKAREDLLLYDSKDLVTHAVCVGMTGSGKTGLCISLIEEAAIDGVPSILIDPKGDLTNLMLTFPNLTGQDFLPWINLDDAQQKGLAPEEYANKKAETWKKGLASWGQDGTRIQRLRDAVETLIYTPGSNAGLQISILKSFSTPPAAILEDEDLFRDRITTTVTSLLGLVGIDAEPMQSREHILLSTILENAWRQGQDLDLAAIIHNVQTPPVTRVGVLDLESFYPSKERFSLVLALNNLLASPGFNAWLQGTPLDIGQILYTPQGKPRIAIFSISHLGDPERMFFVSLLMNQVLGWMRGQSGTTSLRAIVYMDEIFGFLPPIANPPSKLPMITLLKQARAFGVGIVLATQNPVDLDYKGLGNAGTWFIGRLQTERDKARLLDGLEGASATTGSQFNRNQMEKVLSSLGNRVFILNNTHDDGPEIFQTRWALSYLRGPLTRDQIKKLMDPVKASLPAGLKVPHGEKVPVSIPGTGSADSPKQPALSPEIQQVYIPARMGGSQGNDLLYMPRVLGAARINYANTKIGVNMLSAKVYITPITDDPIPVVWDNAEEINIPVTDLEKTSRPGGRFSDLASSASQARNYTAWGRDFSNWIYGTQKVDLLQSQNLKEVSKPGESESEFRVRISQKAREQRDFKVDQLRKKYAPKSATLQERLRRAQQMVEKQAEQAKAAKLHTAINLGSTLLGAFTGRKVNSTTISRASSTVRGFGRAMEESKDVTRAGDTVESIQQQIKELQVEFEAELASLEARIDPSSEVLSTVSLKPNKTDIQVQIVSLAWVPFLRDGQGNLQPAW